MIEGLGKNLNADLKVEAGYLLISEPFLPDPNFERAVVLICEHKTETGSFGFILNKPTELAVAEVMEVEAVHNSVFLGGPVEQNTLHFIHTFDTIRNAIPLKNGVYWGGDFEQLRLYAESGMVSSSNCRFFMGYSGWGKNQLKTELEQNSWIIAKINLKQIFQIPPEELWRSILRIMGGKCKVFASFPDDPRLN